MSIFRNIPFLAVAAFIVALPAHAQGLPPAVPDLDCPSAFVRPPSTVTTPVIAGTSRSEMPPLEELGDLARPVIRDQPLLDPAKTAQFNLQENGSVRPRRIAFWGDSHIAAGPFMTQLEQAIRDRGETVGMGFLPPTMGRANVRLPIRAYCMGSSWETELAFTAPEIIRTGPALANRTVSTGPGSYLWLDLRNADRQPTVRALRMTYRPTEEQTEIAYAIDDGPEQHATLTAGIGASEILEIRGDAPISTVKLSVDTGRLVLHGFILDYDTPPQVTFDVFGIPGATARGWIMADPAYLAQSLHGLDYDAVALEYGTNEGNDPRFDRDKYTTDLMTALSNMRIVFPHASCVLVGPPDRGVLSLLRDRRLDLLRFARIHQQIESIQAQIGAQFGCAAWNWQDLMGGPGGSYGWGLATPRYMGHDLTHLTAAGYRLTAKALANSLGWRDLPLGR